MLKPFVPGDPRINRRGRPKIADHIRKLLDQIGDEKIVVDGVEVTKAETILRNIVNGAIAGDPVKQKFYLEYRYGKPIQQIEANVDQGWRVADFDPETMAFAQKFSANGGDSSDSTGSES